MALKFKYQSKTEIPPEHLSLYAERDGAFVLDAEGVVDKSKLDEFRTNNLSLKNQLAELNAKFEGIDPAAVKTLLAEKVKLEEQKLIKDGEVEKLVENRTKKILGDMETRLQHAEQSASTLSAQLLEKEIERNVVEAGTRLGLRASAIPDLKGRARNIFKISGGTIKGSVLVNAYSNPFAPVKLSVRSICTRLIYRWRSVVSRLPVQARTRREE